MSKEIFKYVSFGIRLAKSWLVIHLKLLLIDLIAKWYKMMPNDNWLKYNLVSVVDERGNIITYKFAMYAWLTGENDPTYGPVVPMSTFSSLSKSSRFTITTLSSDRMIITHYVNMNEGKTFITCNNKTTELPIYFSFWQAMPII